MAFGWAGAAAGASGALQQQQKADADLQNQLAEIAYRQALIRQSESQEQRLREDMAMRQKQFDVLQDERAAERRQITNDRGVASMVFQGIQQGTTTPKVGRLILGQEGVIDPLKALEEPTQPTGDTQWLVGPDGQEHFRVPQPGDSRLPVQSTASAPNVGSFEDYMLADPARRKEIEAGRRAYMQADDRPSQSNAIPGGLLSPTQDANVTNRLVQQWRAASAPAVELDRQVKLMDVGLAAARRGDLAQGAQTILVTFQKILDPPSVVRESEYMRSAAGQALLTRIQGAAEQLALGGAGIPLPELEKFAQLAREAARAQATGHLDSVKRRIGLSADRYRIPHEVIFEDFDLSGGAQPPPNQPAQSQTPQQPAAGGSLYQQYLQRRGRSSGAGPRQ